MLFIGHRGAADHTHPENTIAAVQRALDLGADGVEIDVRLTADGGLVCLHDRSLRRIAGQDRQVAGMTGAQLSAVRLPGGYGLAALADVLGVVAGRGQLIVEMKTELWPVAQRTGTVAALIRELARAGVSRGCDVVVSSFDRAALKELRCRTSVRTALLSRPAIPAGTAIRRALNDGHDQAHPHFAALLRADPMLVADAQAVGLAVTAWTCDRAGDLRRLAALGVQAAICDDPQAARADLTSAQPATRTR